MTAIDSAKARDLAAQIIDKAKQRWVSGGGHSRGEVDTIILPANRMEDLRYLVDWLRFNEYEVVFTSMRMVPVDHVKPEVITVGTDGFEIIGSGKPLTGFPVGFASSKPWKKRSH